MKVLTVIFQVPSGPGLYYFFEYVNSCSLLMSHPPHPTALVVWDPCHSSYSPRIAPHAPMQLPLTTAFSSVVHSPFPTLPVDPYARSTFSERAKMAER